MSLYQILSLIGIPTIVTIIIGLFVKAPLERRVKQNEETAEATRKQSQAIALGVQALLRDRLLQGYKHYFDKGWADYDDRSNMENVYTQYHALGVNGVMDDMRDRFLALPLTPPTK